MVPTDMEGSSRAKIRCPRTPVSDLLDVAALLREADCATAVIDLEPMVASWDTDDAALLRGLDDTIATVTQVPSVKKLVFLTNAARVPSDTSMLDEQVLYIGHARKPWRINALDRLPDPIVVVGDQVLTDGLVAWRLRSRGAVFLHWQVAAMPWLPTTQRALAAPLLPLLFSSEPS